MQTCTEYIAGLHLEIHTGGGGGEIIPKKLKRGANLVLQVERARLDQGGGRVK